MAIDAKNIISDVTLELDDQAITISEFSKAVDNFIGLIKEVTKTTTPAKDAAAWLVDVYPGSVGIGVRAEKGVFSTDEISEIRTQVISGLKDLEHGKRPVQFTDSAVEHSRILGTLLNRKNKPLAVKVWAGQLEAIPLTKEMAEKAEYALDTSYDESGSVEGFLERVNAHGAAHEFMLYDTVSGRGVTCIVDDEILDDTVRNFWKKRVEVTGTVRYRRDGQPISVKAREISKFPEADEIPSLEEMRRLLKGA